MRAFLTNRTATVGISHLRTPSFPALHRGTPQGSVFSPLRFNITLKDLPPLLDTVPSLHHALYADDLTIWTNSGSMGEQQESLQRAIDITTIYLSECGKTCSPEKSALLTLQERTRGRHTAPTPDPALTIETRPVPVVTHLRVLGLTIPRDGSGSHTILALQRTVTQLAQLVTRITHQRKELKLPVWFKLFSSVALHTELLTYPSNQQSTRNLTSKLGNHTKLHSGSPLTPLLTCFYAWEYIILGQSCAKLNELRNSNALSLPPLAVVP